MYICMYACIYDKRFPHMVWRLQLTRWHTRQRGRLVLGSCAPQRQSEFDLEAALNTGKRYNI